jgi:hypothetical protein
MVSDGRANQCPETPPTGLDFPAAFAAVDRAIAWCNENDCASQPSAIGEASPLSPEQMDPAANAIALMIKWDKEGRRYTVLQLAKVVGVSKATLHRDPQFRAARRALRAAYKPPKGSKDSNGNLEAYDD